MSEIKRTLEWFQQAMPEPTDKQRQIQLGCHVEEFSEMLLSVDLLEWAHDITLLSDDLKSGDESVSNLPINKTALLDAMVDQIVTAIGVCHTMGFDLEGALSEVNRSNFSKFEDGQAVFDENGKITKGKHYSKPDLKPYI